MASVGTGYKSANITDSCVEQESAFIVLSSNHVSRIKSANPGYK